MDKILKIFFKIFFITALLANTISAQEKIAIKTQGTYSSNSLSRDKIEQEAIKDAKINALRQAGIPEKVASITISFNSEINEDLLQIFEETTTIETKGEIIVDTILSSEISIDEFNNLVCKVEIESIIFKYDKESDPTFEFNISGINKTYKTSEKLKFVFIPNQDGYLKIFNITRDEVNALYPYEDNKYEYLNDKEGQLFIKNQEISFPVHSAFKSGYSFNLRDNINSEVNYLLFVYTKQNIPYYDKHELKELYKWIYSISPNLRNVKYFTILLTND